MLLMKNIFIDAAGVTVSVHITDVEIVAMLVPLVSQKMSLLLFPLRRVVLLTLSRALLLSSS